MKDLDLFYYWDDEIGSGLPAHLSLCLETWRRNLPEAKVVRVSLSNIETLSGGRLSADQMRLFTPPQRSDAAMAAVLADRAGLFLDADTVLLPNFKVEKYFQPGRIVMYANMVGGTARPLLAFAAGKGDKSPFIENWLSNALAAVRYEEHSLRRRVRRWVRERRGKRVHVRWDYLGAAILDPLALSPEATAGALFHDAQESGFLPLGSSPDYGPGLVNAYWFGRGSAEQFSPTDYRDGIVALQNSWIPDDVRRQDAAAWLRHSSRLGALLKFALEG